MARNVYYDPFGSFTGGLQAGLRDGMNLERGVRDARQMDYNYNVVQPIQTQALRREEDFNQFFDPMRRDLSQYGLDRAKFATGREAIDYAKIPAQLTGNLQPAISALDRYYGVAGDPTGAGGMMWYDTQAPESATGGMPSSYDPNWQQSFSDYYNRPEAMQQAEWMRKREMDEVARQYAAINQQHAINNMYKQLGNVANGANPNELSFVD